MIGVATNPSKTPLFSLQERTGILRHETAPLAAERAEFLASAQTDAPTPAFKPEPRFPYPASTEATARVLEFPRPGTLPFNRDELADPVIDRPRIFEAPELLLPPPALGGMLIERASEPDPERQPGIDMPLQTAPLSRRVFAGAVDGALVAGDQKYFRMIGVDPDAMIVISSRGAAVGIP